MHIADGILSTTTIVASYTATAGLLAYSIKETKDEDISKISLMSATFFAVALISIPVGPSSAHPLICGLVGIILGNKSSISFFIALLLQALLFKHGGLTSLGANTIMLAIPAMISSKIFIYLKPKINSNFLKGAIVASLGVLMTLLILIGILFFTNENFAKGDLSIINILIVAHLPILIIEAIVTGFAVELIEKNKPSLIEK